MHETIRTKPKRLPLNWVDGVMQSGGISTSEPALTLPDIKAIVVGQSGHCDLDGRCGAVPLGEGRGGCGAAPGRSDSSEVRYNEPPLGFRQFQTIDFLPWTNG